MMNSFDPQYLEQRWGWIVIAIIIILAIVLIVFRIRKHQRQREFRKCTDVFLEERYQRGELIRKNVPERIY